MRDNNNKIRTSNATLSTARIECKWTMWREPNTNDFYPLTANPTLWNWRDRLEWWNDEWATTIGKPVLLHRQTADVQPQKSENCTMNNEIYWSKHTICHFFCNASTSKVFPFTTIQSSSCHAVPSVVRRVTKLGYSLNVYVFFSVTSFIRDWIELNNFAGIKEQRTIHKVDMVSKVMLDWIVEWCHCVERCRCFELLVIGGD